ncbi:MAG TPA: hypothetical protein VG184_01545 [Acidimicrobiales bacterium]|nr:hypothetical protein [Acidimicrobiales bacterium]
MAAAQPAPCAVALAYLAAHAAPGFAHYCRPGLVTLSNGVVAHSFTCYPGTLARCPDGGPEIVITDPGCVAAYEDEASNSFWNFAQTSGYIGPGAVQNGRVWDPFGECVA